MESGRNKRERAGRTMKKNRARLLAGLVAGCCALTPVMQTLTPLVVAAAENETQAVNVARTGTAWAESVYPTQTGSTFGIAENLNDGSDSRSGLQAEQQYLLQQAFIWTRFIRSPKSLRPLKKETTSTNISLLPSAIRIGKQKNGSRSQAAITTMPKPKDGRPLLSCPKL